MQAIDPRPTPIARTTPQTPARWWDCANTRVVRLFLLGLTVCAVWLSIEDRWGSNFHLPTRYGYDAHYILGMMKLAQDGDLGLFTHITTESLGAPFTGQLNDFPQAERAIVWSGGQLARVIGLMEAANTLLILSCIIAAFSFYSALRLWKVSRLPSWLFAVTYAFLPHNLRSLEHLGIIFTGLLPLQFYVLWYIATAQKLSWSSFQFRLSLGIGLVSGAINVYWIFLFVNLYTLALLCRLVKRRGDLFRALLPVLATCFVAAAFLGSFVIYKASHSENPMALARLYQDVEIWSLKPIDLFLPEWGRGRGVIGNLLSRYYDGGQIHTGEHARPYIGLCSIAGLLFLLFRGTQRQINKRAPSLAYLATVWIIAYISFGGIHSIFSLTFDFYHIRNTNRYATAIATIGLLYLSFLSCRHTRQWPLAFRAIPLALIAAFGLLEQSRLSYTRSHIFIPTATIAEQIDGDRLLVSSLENKLKAGSMIYILPATDFPEPYWGRGAFKGDFHHYQAMRPFLYSTQLRYSYGSNKGRKGADWQLDVQELPPRDMATTLESYGFAGILLNRKGYEDRGENLLAELNEAGWPMEFEQGVDSEWVFIPLTPAPNPVLPTLTPYAVSEGWDPSIILDSLIHPGR